MKTVRTNFLGAGPGLNFLIADELDATPEAMTVIDFGGGGRTVTYQPGMAEPLDNPEYSPVRTSSDVHGHQITVHEKTKLPRSWILAWSLPGGMLFTHVRDLEGYETVRYVIDNLEIVADGGASVPSLLMRGALALRVSQQPGYQESLTWKLRRPLDEGETAVVAVTARRPGVLSVGKRLHTDGLGGGALAVGTQYGIDIEALAIGPGDFLKLARETAESAAAGVALATAS